MSEDKIKVKYEYGAGIRFEAEGAPDEVWSHTTLFHQGKLRQDTQGVLVLDGSFPEVNRPTGESYLLPSEAPIVTVYESTAKKPVDLKTFFKSKKPKDQNEEVVVIAYFLQMIEGKPGLLVADFESAYGLLKQIPIAMPKNLNSAVSNAQYKRKFLTRYQGEIILTDLGKEFVENMGNEQ